MNNIDIRQLFGGLGVFLYGLFLFQVSIKKVGSYILQKTLQKRTSTKIKSVLSGVRITTLLQSSSITIVLILGFLGANIVNLTQALGITIGATIGSTSSSRLIALLGFQVDLSQIVMPMLGIFGIGSILSSKKRTIHYRSIFLFGFALLLFGITLMKTSVTQIETGLGVSQLSLSLRIYLLLGIGTASILQSSAITNIMVFTAFSSGLISFEASIAIIIGGGIGTTTTGILGAIGGTTNQKRLNIFNVSYNIILGLILFAVITPSKNILQYIGFKESILALTAYHTFSRILGAILITPRISFISTRLQEKINKKNKKIIITTNSNDDEKTQKTM